MVHTHWLLETTVFEAIRAAVESGDIPTVAQVAQFEAEARDRSEAGGILSIADDKAEIRIFGVLTPRPDFMAMLFGGGNTTYGEITAALADAEQDPNVTAITLAIDSPGGSIAGLFDTLAALQGVIKPLRAVVHNTAASAAYAIASQADSIEAANVSSSVGSIGVVAKVRVSDEVVSISSTKAPRKAPDVTTARGKAVIRDQLDAYHEIFVDAIAEGRSITVETVNADFGRGAVVLAEEALRRGMIDGVMGVNTEAAAKSGDRKTEARKMDLATLKAEHPGAYALAVDAGVAKGVAQERDRVGAHLTMGETSGDMKTASAAILNGDEMTATLQAKYMAAGMNKSDTEARQAEDVDVAPADGAAAPKAENVEADAVDDAVVDLVAQNFGREV